MCKVLNETRKKLLEIQDELDKLRDALDRADDNHPDLQVSLKIRITQLVNLQQTNLRFANMFNEEMPIVKGIPREAKSE